MARSVSYLAHFLMSMYADIRHRALQTLSAAARHSAWEDADGVMRDERRGKHSFSGCAGESNRMIQKPGCEVYMSHTDGMPIMPLLATSSSLT